MANNDKQYKIYLKENQQWVPVPETFYRDYYREINNFRHRQQHHGRCICKRSQWWLCDMNCGTCEFHEAGDHLSFEAEMETDEGATNFEKMLPGATLDVEETFLLIDTIDALRRELAGLDPESRLICQFFMEGKTEREGASILGLTHSTYRRHWEDIIKYLRDKLQDYM